jgi:hydrogenase expression/formation protein HypD
MKYVDEYRDPELAEGVVSAIREKSRTPVRFMEVCGTHTVAIFRSGLKELLPETVTLISANASSRFGFFTAPGESPRG